MRNLFRLSKRTAITPPGLPLPGGGVGLSRIAACAAVALIAGCSDLSQPPPNEAGRMPSAPGQQMGLHDSPLAPPPAQAEPPKPQDSVIGKTTARVVDYQKAMQENPRLIVKENKAQGNDPLSFAASAYVSARSRASLLNFQHNLDIMKAINENKNLTYDEVIKLMKQTGLELAALYPYQMYAYDEQTGALMILEDPDDKAARYRQAGVPLEDESTTSPLLPQ